MFTRIPHMGMNLSMARITKPNYIKTLGVILMVCLCAFSISARSAWQWSYLTSLDSLLDRSTRTNFHYILGTGSLCSLIRSHVHLSMRGLIVYSVIFSEFFTILNGVFTAIYSRFCIHAINALAVLWPICAFWLIYKTNTAYHESEYTL